MSNMTIRLMVKDHKFRYIENLRLTHHDVPHPKQVFISIIMRSTVAHTLIL